MIIVIIIINSIFAVSVTEAPEGLSGVFQASVAWLSVLLVGLLPAADQLAGEYWALTPHQQSQTLLTYAAKMF